MLSYCTYSVQLKLQIDLERSSKAVNMGPCVKTGFIPVVNKKQETYLVMMTFMDTFLKTIYTQYTSAIIATVPETENSTCCEHDHIGRV